MWWGWEVSVVGVGGTDMSLEAYCYSKIHQVRR